MSSDEFATEQSLSGRLLALVLMLSIVSAAVGAGVALLLRGQDNDSGPEHEVAVVATVRTASQESEATGSEQVVEAGTQPDGEGRSQAQAQRPEPEAGEEAQAANTQVIDDSPAEQTQSELVEDVSGQPETIEAEPADTANVATALPEVIVQGEAFAVTVASNDARAAVATLEGRSWDLVSMSHGVWWGVLAVPRDANIGVAQVLVDLYGEGGVWQRTIPLSVVVLAHNVPLEEIELGGTGAPADPAAVAEDIAVRFSEHTAVSGPPRWQGVWTLPLEGEVTGLFGSQRSYDGVMAEGWHHGHDIAAQHGDPIVAPAHGTVVWSGDLVLHGMGVIIDHGAGVYSGYWHMSLIAVREGVQVAPGDWLGNVGTTGLSTGPHLHWEVIVRGIDVDPVQWIGEDRPPLPTAEGAAR